MANQVDLSVMYVADPTIGRPIPNSSIYVGIVDLDPKVVGNQKQISVLQENGTTVEVGQPISTSAGGQPIYNGSPVTILVDGSYSLRIDDSTGTQVYYVPQNAVAESLEGLDSIDDLRAITYTPEDGQVVNVLGYYAKTENRDWSFQWDATSTASDNNGTIIKVTSIATGRWYRLYNKSLDVTFFGAVSDLGTGNTDNVTAIARTVAWAKSENGAVGGRITFDDGGSGYLTSQNTITDYDGLILDGNNVKIKMIDTGINNYIFLFNTCEDIEVKNFKFIGTSGTVTTYDDANRQAGIGVDGGSLVTVHNNVFENFISYGIRSENMSLSAAEGMRIYENIFRNFVLDATTDDQCGIYLSSEYSVINNNTFRQIPSAARFIDGANSKFLDNIVYNLNGKNSPTTAAFYHALQLVDSNFGKLLIDGNTFNHIDSGQTIMKIVADNSVDRNPCIISNNQLISNGTVVNSKQIWIEQSPRTRVLSNNIRPNIGLSWASGDDNIRVVDSANVTIKDNYLNGGDYAITTDNSTLIIGRNDIENHATGLIQYLNSGTWKYSGNRVFAFHVLANGTFGPDINDDPNLSAQAHITTGIYDFEHTFGTANFVANVTSDEDYLVPAERHWVVLRRALVLEVSCYDATPALVDQDFVMTITHGIDSEYLLTVF